MEIIYLASPYSHPDRWVQFKRYEAVCQVAMKMFREGLFVYSPICHTVSIAEYGLPEGYKVWREFDHEMIRRCDKVVVLMMMGWKESVGVQDEIKFALEIGKTVEYMEVPSDI